MSYQVHVYFDGPRSKWGEKLDRCEVIFHAEVRWLWFARHLARRNVGNTGRCAYVISRDGVTIEQVNATPLEAETP